MPHATVPEPTTKLKGQMTSPAPSANMAPPDTERSSSALSSEQAHALFHILSHHDTYEEIARLKYPETVSTWGPPFKASPATSEKQDAAESSHSPLALLMRKVIVPAPGMRELSPEFFSVKVQGILERFAAAELSESYDKGALGTRKTLATGASSVVEYFLRGIFGGLPRRETQGLHGQYDSSKAEDLNRAWKDALHDAVYGDLIDELLDQFAETGNVEDHSPAVKVAIDYIILHLATSIHHTFVLSSEGQYLLKLIENAHKLTPYAMMKQILRVGNAATMINGMMRLLLAKVGVGALSNWVGLTTNADDGMNLLQRIISLVLNWDSSEFKKLLDKIEKTKGGPSKEHLAALKQYMELSREEHDEIRLRSIRDEKSIVTVIFEQQDPSLLDSLSDDQHKQCLDYYSALLSNRDRDEIVKVLCRQQPDLFTQLLKEEFAAFEPMIRTVHEKIDLREHLSSVESFLNDFIKTGKGTRNGDKVGSSSIFKRRNSEPRPPSVEDYVNLLRDNRQLMYNFLHQFAKNCPELREIYREWAKETLKAFRQNDETHQTLSGRQAAGSRPPGKNLPRPTAAGAVTTGLEAMFTELPEETRAAILPVLDEYESYLSSIERLSQTRMQRLLDNLATRNSDDGDARRVSNFNGPGMFLQQWEDLLAATRVSPATRAGPPRSGTDVKGAVTQGKTGVSPAKDAWNNAGLVQLGEKELPPRPDVAPIVEALGDKYNQMIRALARD